MEEFSKWIPNKKYAKELEEQIWLWSRGLGFISPIISMKKPTLRKKKLTSPVNPSGVDSVQRKSRKGPKSPKLTIFDSGHISYETKFKQLLESVSRNPDLWKNYNPSQLVCLTDTLLHPNYSNAAARSITEDEIKAICAADDPHCSGNTLQFLQCRKCKSTRVSFDQKQLSGGDEPMTTICQCNDCHCRWKM